MKRRILILIVLAVPTGFVIGLLLYLRSHGFSSRTEPSTTEAFVARQLRAWAIPRAAREAANPVPLGPEVLTHASEHFADHCASCHANDGSGNTPIGKGLYPKPPDMRTGITQNLTDGEIYYAIHNGVRFTGMPAFGEDKPGVTDEDSWKLVHFIRHLPKITEDELQAMKKFNPQSPAELEEEEQIRRFLAGEDLPQEEHVHNHD